MIAMSALFFTTCLLQVNAAPWIHRFEQYFDAVGATAMLPAPGFNVRGGEVVGRDGFLDPPFTTMGLEPLPMEELLPPSTQGQA